MIIDIKLIKVTQNTHFFISGLMENAEWRKVFETAKLFMQSLSDGTEPPSLADADRLMDWSLTVLSLIQYYKLRKFCC